VERADSGGRYDVLVFGVKDYQRYPISHTKHRKFWSHLVIAMLLYNLPSDVALPLRNYLSLSAPIPPTSYDLAFATGCHAAYFGFVLNTRHLLVYAL
jgi:hypothetical protein